MENLKECLIIKTTLEARSFIRRTSLVTPSGMCCLC